MAFLGSSVHEPDAICHLLVLSCIAPEKLQRPSRNKENPHPSGGGASNRPSAAGFRREQVQTITLQAMRTMKTVPFWHLSQNCYHSLKVSNRKDIPTYFLRCYQVLTMGR